MEATILRRGEYGDTILHDDEVSRFEVMRMGDFSSRRIELDGPGLIHPTESDFWSYVGRTRQKCWGFSSFLISSGGTVKFSYDFGHKLTSVFVVRLKKAEQTSTLPTLKRVELSEVPLTARPGGINLRSASAHLEDLYGCKLGIGYEWFRLSDSKMPNVPVHSHTTSGSIVMVVQGSGRVLLGNEWHDIFPDDIVTIPPGLDHTFEGRLGAFSFQTRPILNDYVLKKA